MDFRKTYDQIPEKFDQWRPRYCDELFAAVIEYTKLEDGKAALEIGPGTGQATEPFLKTGCEYWAIELGENFTKFMKDKFSSYPRFHIMNGDFETYDFGVQKFDLVYSAATIQWIPEKIGFPKVYDLLKSGGALAMFMTLSDEKSGNEILYEKIEEAYRRYFRVETKYNCKLDYGNAVNYGFVDFHYLDWKRTRILTADEYVEYLVSTQVEHITLQEPYRSRFLNAVRDAVLDAGGRIMIHDTIALYLTRKP